MPFAIKKVPGGKLIRVDVNIENSAITSCHITGDFFLHPENTLSRMEVAIDGAALPLDSGLLKKKLEKITLGTTIVGFTLDDLTSLLQEILSKGNDTKGTGDAHE